MTESKHTPGPWHFNPSPYELGEAAGYTIREATGLLIARVMRLDDRPLIAAAPETAAERDRLRESNAELVEALKMARECIAYCRRSHPDPQKGEGAPVEAFIDAAIAKAWGET